MKKIYYHTFEIQGHSYLLGATDKGLAFVGSWDHGIAELKQFYPDAILEDDFEHVIKYEEQLEEYLEGSREEFTFMLDTSGTTFQEAVWQELKRIPYGEVSNYTKIAKAINKPKAVRAVGTAIGKNPVLIVVPCHRVLTKAGDLGGYRGGIKMKRALLDLETKCCGQ